MTRIAPAPRDHGYQRKEALLEAGQADTEEKSSGRGHVIWFSCLAACVVVLLILTRISIATSFHSTTADCPPSSAEEELQTMKTEIAVATSFHSTTADCPPSSAEEELQTMKTEIAVDVVLDKNSDTSTYLPDKPEAEEKIISIFYN